MTIVFIAGCSLFGPSCDEREDQLVEIYNGYIESSASLTESEILKECKTAVEKCPDCVIGYELAGLVHWENERLHEALAFYRSALTLDPEDEQILADTQLVAYSAEKVHLFVGDDGTIQTRPFREITLGQYAMAPEGNRLQWCESRLKARLLKSTEKDIVDKSGNTVGSQSFTMSYDITSAEDFDDRLLSEAASEPDGLLAKASTKVHMSGSVSYGATIY
jgi:hypothetical protein